MKQELKFNDVRENKPRLQKNPALWSQIEKGIGQATIIVIDPGAYEPMVRDTLDNADIERAGSERQAVTNACVSEVLSGTPIAYLPYAIFRQVPWSDEKSLTSLVRFTPEGILSELGGKLQHALVFAARAHAVFDVSSAHSMTRTTDAFRSQRAARLILPEVLATTRYFDIENRRTTDLLNSAINAIAESFSEALEGAEGISDQPLVIESDSRGYDEIQAADISAGWAREMLELGDPRGLATRFERVWLNGERIK